MAKLERLKHRLFVAAALTSGEHHELSTEANHYLRNVLRLKSGASLHCFDNCGREFVSEYQTNSKKSGTLLVGDCTREHPNNVPELQLAICLIKGSALDYALQKVTELGVTHIWPLLSARSEVRLNVERQQRKAAHWQAVVTSAAEQSGRLTVPTIAAIQSLEDYVCSAACEQRFVLDPEANMNVYEAKPVNTSVLIGPEGGLTKQEIKLCSQHGFLNWKLGARTLRADTASVAALAVLQQMMGWP